MAGKKLSVIALGLLCPAARKSRNLPVLSVRLMLPDRKAFVLPEGPILRFLKAHVGRHQNTVFVPHLVGGFRLQFPKRFEGVIALFYQCQLFPYPRFNAAVLFVQPSVKVVELVRFAFAQRSQPLGKFSDFCVCVPGAGHLPT